ARSEVQRILRTRLFRGRRVRPEVHNRLLIVVAVEFNARALCDEGILSLDIPSGRAWMTLRRTRPLQPALLREAFISDALEVIEAVTRHIAPFIPHGFRRVRGYELPMPEPGCEIDQNL